MGEFLNLKSIWKEGVECIEELIWRSEQMLKRVNEEIFEKYKYIILFFIKGIYSQKAILKLLSQQDIGNSWALFRIWEDHLVRMLYISLEPEKRNKEYEEFSVQYENIAKDKRRIPKREDFKEYPCKKMAL